MKRKNATSFSLKNSYTLTVCLFAALGVCGQSAAQDHPVNACTKTKNIALSACTLQADTDEQLASAQCVNIVDTSDRRACVDDAKATRLAKREECIEQKSARSELCGLLGEAPYDPGIYWKAENFVDPKAIGKTIPANAYMPLVQGVRNFEGADETVVVTVTSETKLIDGVTCLVVTDTVYVEGKLLEDTLDWFAQDVQGNVWYCGEISQNYEIFSGDVPENPELVHIEGSWKAFRDGALPGIVMQAVPQDGEVYRQEMKLGSAEDSAQIITSKADGLLAGDECEEDGDEITALIDGYCNNDCIVTNDFTPLSPGNFEHKYYAAGVGFVLEVNPDGECLVVDDN